MSPDTAPVERLHPLTLLTGLGGRARQLAGGYAGLGYLAVTGQLSVALALGAVLLVAVAVGTLIYWRRFTFRVGPDEIRIDSGIVSRTHRSIPFDRVQDVDIEQGPISRLLGLAKVKFQTGASAGPNKDEGVLPGIALARAEALRQHVRARRGTVAAASDSPEPDLPLFAMDLPRVLTAGLFNFSLAIFAGLIGLSQTLGNVIGFDPFERSFWEGLLNRDSGLVNYAATHRSFALGAGLALLIGLGSLTGVVRTLLRDWHFRLDRSAAGLRRQRGLLTLTDDTVPLRRVQAALVVTGPIRELFGWRTLKLQSLGSDAADKGDHVVAPLANPDEIARIIDELGWPRPVDARLQKVSLAFVWMRIASLVPWFALMISAGLIAVAVTDRTAIALASTFLIAGAAGGVLLAAAAARFLSWQHTGFRLDHDQLTIRTGWWHRRTALLPVRRIQSIELAQSFMDRAFGVTNMRLGVAGGSGFSGHVIPALPHELALALRRDLLSSQP